MARKNVKKTVKKQSVKEFKAWLEGITEFQPNDWCPSAEQWKTIKDKIGNLQDEIIVKEQIMVQSSTPSNLLMTNNLPIQHNVEPVYSDVPQLQVRPNTPGKITLLPVGDEPVEHIDYPVPVDQTGQPIITTISSTVSASGKTYKTPHIDTSDGKYRSGFV